MGAEAAIKPGAPPAQDQDQQTSRSARFSAVAEIVALYHDLTRALAQTRDGELVHLVAAAREGEQAFEQWARRIEEFRGFKRRFEAGVHPADTPPPARTALAATRPAPAPNDRSPLPLLWEALAFVFGFVMSFLVT